MSSSEIQITFLGTGTSVGVPVIGCACDVCRSFDSRNKRTRSSILVSVGTDAIILVDSGPDLREQALREGLTRIDAVLYTHSHVDHVVGFDELRAFCWGREEPLPLYASSATLETLKCMFGWAFHAENTHRGYVKPSPQIITKAFCIGSLKISPLPVEHGSVDTLGFLFETTAGSRIAYLPDVKYIPEETLTMMQNLDVLILDGLRDTPHSTHLSVAEACKISVDLKPRQTFLTHISHDLDHDALSKRLPANISPAYDGLEITLR